MSTAVSTGQSREHAAASAHLRIGQTTLVLQQNEIKALEAAADVRQDSPSGRSVGWIGHAGQRWPVYCLSDQLTLQSDVPAGRRACILLADGSGYIAMLCDDVIVARQEAPRNYEVPAAMRMTNMPIRALVPVEGGMGCITAAPQLVSYITQMAGM